MKIGALTVFFIIWTLMFAFVGYTDKMILDSQREMCNELRVVPGSDLESSENCFLQSQIYSTKYGMMMFLVFTFVSLIAISIKIDNPDIGKSKK